MLLYNHLSICHLTDLITLEIVVKYEQDMPIKIVRRLHKAVNKWVVIVDTYPDVN